jgi:hypothetical protein
VALSGFQIYYQTGNLGHVMEEENGGGIKNLENKE